MGQTEYLLIIIIFNVFLLIFVVAVVNFVIQYKNKKRENSLKLEQQKILHQKELLATEVEIQMQTMQQIGREIHDNVGQKLTLASLYTQQLTFENKSEPLNERIDQIGDIINQSLADLRLLSKTLTDNSIENNDIATLLRREIARISELNKFQISLMLDDEKLDLSYELKSVILRVTQEFFQNSIKYSNCTEMSISLLSANNQLSIELMDNGIGFDVQNLKSQGIGLSNMKRRISLIGGEYVLTSKANEGTFLKVNLPLSK